MMQTNQIKKAVWAMLLATSTALASAPAYAQHFGGGPWGGGHFGGPGGGWHGGRPGGWGGHHATRHPVPYTPLTLPTIYPV